MGSLCSSDEVPYVKTETGFPIVYGDYLFDQAYSKVLHVVILLVAMTMGYSFFVALSEAVDYDADLRWVYDLFLFTIWVFASFVLTVAILPVTYGNHPKTKKQIFLPLSWALAFVYIVCSDIYYYAVNVDNVSFGDFLGEGSKALFDWDGTDEAIHPSYPYFLVKYTFFIVLLIFSGVFVFPIAWCSKDPKVSSKKKALKKATKWFGRNIAGNTDPFRNYPGGLGFIVRLKQHWWPSSNISHISLKFWDNTPIIYPAKLWTASILNLMIVMIASLQILLVLRGLNGQFTTFTRTYIERSQTFCNETLGKVDGLQSDSGFTLIDDVSDLCYSCNISKFDNFVSNYNAYRNGLITDIQAVADPLNNAGVDALVADLTSTTDIDFTAFKPIWTETCRIIRTLEDLRGDEENSFDVAGRWGCALSILFGVCQSVLTFLAWRKKFINHHYMAHAYAYRKVNPEEVYNTNNWARFVATFVGNGIVSVFVLYFVVFVIYSFRFIFSWTTIDDRLSYTRPLAFAEDALPKIGNIVIYLVLDKVLVGQVLPRFGATNFRHMGFLSIWLELFYLPKGILSGIYKIFTYLIFFIAGFARPDCSIMPFGAEGHDASHFVYVSSIRYIYNEYYWINQDFSPEGIDEGAKAWEDVKNDDKPDTGRLQFGFSAADIAENMRSNSGRELDNFSNRSL